MLALVPTVEAPDLSGWVSGLSGVWVHAAWLNKYVPLDQAALMLGIVGVAFVASYAFRFAVWCLTKLHVLGGS